MFVKLWWCNEKKVWGNNISKNSPHFSLFGSFVKLTPPAKNKCHSVDSFSWTVALFITSLPLKKPRSSIGADGVSRATRPLISPPPQPNQTRQYTTAVEKYLGLCGQISEAQCRKPIRDCQCEVFSSERTEPWIFLAIFLPLRRVFYNFKTRGFVLYNFASNDAKLWPLLFNPSCVSLTFREHVHPSAFVQFLDAVVNCTLINALTTNTRNTTPAREEVDVEPLCEADIMRC